jgi:hypothetical protein
MINGIFIGNIESSISQNKRHHLNTDCHETQTNEDPQNGSNLHILSSQMGYVSSKA